ncbi:MAG: hypothetical protein KDC66_05720 [Phaeodactylibacter sp.]|nr:hypothetical protein [Phaeodactylibacter sp.]MCB9277050.1 hypothetical protein [Lewinellaceae bacterium]
MKNIVFLAASALLIWAAYSCKTATKAQDNAPFNYGHLYKTWVVDTIIVLRTEAVSTPNIETDKNEYRFTKEGTSINQGARTTITSGASFDVPYTIKDGTINFDAVAIFPLLNFDKNGNLMSSSYVALPPYKIMELGPTTLTLKNNDILMKLKAK